MVHESPSKELQGQSLLCGPALTRSLSLEGCRDRLGWGWFLVLTPCSLLVPLATLVLMFVTVYLGGAQATLGLPLLSAPG